MLAILPFLVVLMYGLKGGGRYIQSYFTQYIGQDIIRKLQNKMLSSLLKMDMEYFLSQKSGELISRIINDIVRLKTVVSIMIPAFFRDILTILALSGVVTYQSPKLSLYFLLIMPISIYPLSKLAKKMKKISKKSQEKISDITASLTETFNNIETIKANVLEKREAERFKNHSLKFFKITLKSVKVSEAVSPLMETVGAIVVALVIYIGGKEVIDGNMSVGAFFSFMTALFMLYTPLKNISKTHNTLQDAAAASERIFEIIELEAPKESKKNFNEKIKKIAFKNVSLRYGNKIALENISFEIEKSKILALVGESGGGKSSIVNLLIRFFSPTKGEILINDKNMEEFSEASVRKRIAFISQRVYIFQDSIAKNVSLEEKFDEKRVIEALKLANAYEFVEKLEGGINHVLREFGNNLSGGQRQRIALARAFYKNTDVIVLDEATSALDNISERRIKESFKSISKDKILIIIAHKLSTIKDADIILFLKKGKVQCRGNYEELLKNCPSFANMHFNKEI
jgi:subfamily B ATP-binding cassette protein MsbA